MARKIADLEELVKIWAWDTFQKTCFREHKKLEYRDVRLEVNWSRLKLTSTKPAYSDERSVKKANSQIVFRSTYENRTESSQDHSFQTERTTVSSCTTSVTKGFTKGMHLEIKLGLPDEVAGVTAGFGREVSMESTDESTHEEVMTWSVNSNIKVPPHHRTTAKLVVYENEYNGKFKLIVDLRGQVIVAITNLKENNCFVQSVDGNICEIMRAVVDKIDSKGVTIDNTKVTWEMEGKCHFRYGVDQHVKLKEKPLEPGNEEESPVED